MASDTGKIVSRHKKLESKKIRWNNIFSDIARNMIPLREDALQDRESGVRQGDEIYDGTGASALNILVKGLYGKMVNPASTWFKLRFRTEELNELPEVKEWTQRTQRHLYNVFQDSNFYDSIEAFLRDGAGFGTAIMTIDEDTGDGKLVYQTVNLNQCFIEQNSQGKVDTLHRQIKSMQAKQIVDFFGDDTPQMVKDAMKEDPFKEFEILNAVFPRELRDSTKIDNKNMEWESSWILMGQSGNQQGNSSGSQGARSGGAGKTPMEIKESGHKEFPYIVWRWETNGIEEYGRCPGMYALADVMGLNLMGKDILQLSELVANPPMNVFQGTEEDVNFMPAGINVIEGPEQAPHPTDIGGAGYPVALDQIQAKQEAVKKHFFVDAFLFLASQGADARLTATEVIAREGENAMILGSVIGKLSQALDQIIDTTFRKEFEAGRIDEPPAIVLELEGERIDVVYTGPLAQAQRAFFETSGINKSLEVVGAMAQLDPNVLKVVDLQEAARIQLDALGMPQKAIRTREEVEAANQQQKQIEQQALELQAGATQASSLKDLAKADKDTDGKVSEALEEQGA